MDAKKEENNGKTKEGKKGVSEPRTAHGIGLQMRLSSFLLAASPDQPWLLPRWIKMTVYTF